MGLRASADEENFALSWTQEEPGGRCRIGIHGNRLVLKDLDSSHQQVVGTFRRVFAGSGPGLEISRKVELGSLIAGFSAVPQFQRCYTLSITLFRQFRGPLPDTVAIQLPDIEVGDCVVGLNRA